MAISTVLTQVQVLLILLGIGYYLSARHIVTDTGIQQLTALLCFLIMPCVLFSAFEIPFRQDICHNLLLTAMAAVFTHALPVFLSPFIFSRKLIPDSGQRAALQFSASYSNCDFMGLPLLMAIGGSNGLFYGSAYLFIDGLFIWTHGLLLYTHEMNIQTLWKSFKNPNILTTFIGLIVYYFSIPLPHALSLTVHYIAQINTGLAMIVVGATLTRFPISTIFSTGKAWAGMLTHNLLIPLLMISLLRQLPLLRDVYLTCMIFLACPIASFSVMFPQLTHQDTVFPGQILALSTLSCIITIPLILTLAG